MAKKGNNFHSAFLTALILAMFAVVFIKGSSFTSIPDAVKLPDEVKNSIKNLKPQKSFKVPILLYHYVEYVKDPGDTIRRSLNIEPYLFEEEVRTLKDNGYTFITTSDLADVLDDKKTLPPKPVILTFDDGYRDFYTDVFPILKKYQAKAVVYVVPNFLDRQNNLDTWMLSEIAKSGLVEIGAHTMDHFYLTGLPFETVKYQVEKSKQELEKQLGFKVVSFAYPYGAFNNETIDAVRKAGFRTAVTTIDGIFAQDLNRFFLYRIRPGGRVGQELLSLLESTKLSKK